jgi:hypothetical protein
MRTPNRLARTQAKSDTLKLLFVSLLASASHNQATRSQIFAMKDQSIRQGFDVESVGKLLRPIQFL